MAATQTENVAGAVVFFGYIAAALVFTGLIGRDLVELYEKSHDVKKIRARSVPEIVRRREKAQIFIVLSLISFGALSYHMLRFLIISYTNWGHSSKVLVPQVFLGENGIFDFQGRQTPLSLWLWSKRSTLFQTFAETIVGDPRRYWWTQQVLLYSLGWNIFMAVEGVRYEVPHLWMYFVLDQILPVSFTQNLFCAAVFLIQDLPQAAKLKAAPPGDQFVISTLYLLGLSVAHNTVATTAFFFVLFAIRALLFAPFWMLRPKVRASTKVAGGSSEGLYWQYRYSALILAVGGLFLHVRQTQIVLPIVDTARAISDDPSLSALGYDYIIAVLSLMVFIALTKFGL